MLIKGIEDVKIGEVLIICVHSQAADAYSISLRRRGERLLKQGTLIVAACVRKL